MRINQENNSIDIEPRDLNFVSDAYAVQYAFYCKNKRPEKIIIPMVQTAHTRYGDIPVEFVPIGSAIAIDIIEDGKAVVETSPEQVDKIAEQEEEIKKLKEQLKQHAKVIDSLDEKLIEAGESLTIKEPVKNIEAWREVAAPPDSGIHVELTARDARDLQKAKADLQDKEIDESKEKAVGINKAADGSKRWQ